MNKSLCLQSLTNERTCGNDEELRYNMKRGSKQTKAPEATKVNPGTKKHGARNKRKPLCQQNQTLRLIRSKIHKRRKPL